MNMPYRKTSSNTSHCLLLADSPVFYLTEAKLKCLASRRQPAVWTLHVRDSIAAGARIATIISVSLAGRTGMSGAGIPAFK